MSTRSLNKVFLIGNLTRDPELRYTPSGTAVCTFGMATNRQWVTESGEKKEDAEFHRIVAWQKLAEICGKYLQKGKKVFIEGRIQTRSWTGQDGQQRTTTEIVIDNMMMLDGTRREGDEETIPARNVDVKPKVQKQSDTQKKQPQATSDDNDAVPAPSDTAEDVSPEDIPF